MKIKNISLKNADAYLVSSTTNINYLSKFSGFSAIEREGYILITKKRNYIITDGRYTQAVKNTVQDFEIIEISSKNTLDYVFEKLISKNRIKTLAVEEENLTVKEYKKLLKYFKKIVGFNLDKSRSVKNKKEVALIEKACKLTDRTFEFLIKKIKVGITEKELSEEIYYFAKRNNADISFGPIVAFGKNSAIPHHKSGNLKLESSDIILMDFGTKIDNYCSDMTRTVFFGKPTNAQKKAYNIVLRSQEKAIEFLNSGLSNKIEIKASDIDEVARNYITSQGYPSISHSLGHGIGLEVHESPRISPKSKDILKQGMVFSIEPGIYFPEEFGIRIEDLVLIEKNKLKILTNSRKNIIEL